MLNKAYDEVNIVLLDCNTWRFGGLHGLVEQAISICLLQFCLRVG